MEEAPTSAAAIPGPVPSPGEASTLSDFGPDVTPVGSPENAIPDIHLLRENHDHGDDVEHAGEQGREEDFDLDQDQSGGTAVPSEDLKHRIIKQVEYYFSDENLPTDKHLLALVKKNKDGFVPIAVIASFRKMKKLTSDNLFIVAALRESSLLVVSSSGKNIRRLHPLSFTEVRDPKLCTVLVENLPEDHSVENIRRIFGEAGSIKKVSIRDPQHMDKTEKVSMVEVLTSSKLHALVEYETVEAAEKAAATLNDEQDWRNSMRVKLITRMGKYVQRRQPWRGSDSEKNITGRVSDQTGDENAHTINKHNDYIHDEEEEDHLSKDKNGHKARNRGRSRRNNYKGINGMGHGSPSPSLGVETSKPPPGPRMPDGTRGFTMGRGRSSLPVSNPS